MPNRKFGVLKNDSNCLFSENLRLTEQEIEQLIVSKRYLMQKMQPLVFKRLHFKSYFEPGSCRSIEFHHALAQTTQTAIFGSEPIKKILEYKWQ